MALDQGSFWRKATFAALIGVYLVGLGISLSDKMSRVGQPDVGWMIDDGYVSPTRFDVSEAGLRGGGRALRLNGVDVGPKQGRSQEMPAARREVGATNTLVFERPNGVVAEITAPVRLWEWQDVLFTDGAVLVLGFLFVAVGVISFLLRPYTAASWALLTLCAFAGGFLSTVLVPIEAGDVVTILYFDTVAGFHSAIPFHVGLAFPAVHPLLIRHPRILVPVYVYAVVQSALYVAAYETDFQGPFAYARMLGAAILLIGILLFIGRCLYLSLPRRDPLIAQRARLLLAGTVFGLAPIGVLQVLQQFFDIVPVDDRFVFWLLGLFLLPLAHVTVRHELLNARIAVRRAVLYASAVGVLTVCAMLLVTVHRYAVAALLLPVLYWWPRFDARLNDWLYPQRSRFPELLRSIGDEMAAANRIDDVLRVLAQTPVRLCDASRAVAFILPAGGPERVRYNNVPEQVGNPPLAKETLVRLMTTTRKEIFRNRIALEPQFANIQAECYAGFDRLQAEALLPILRDGEVIGGMAVGPRATRDVYDAADIDALTTVAQQATQAIVRIEATDRLRERELEFADLKRFFPPQIIDQVMARGGVAEMRSQRKVVTVVFADLRGFTSFSETAEPEEVMATLAEYHSAMGRRIAEHAGTLERFAGDGFMVFFNDPVDQPDHVQRAAQMALAMRADVQRLREEWLRHGYQIDVGIGIHTGYATCGFIGYEGRRDYGVIGNVTNLAARLSDAAGPGEILITARVQSELRNGFRAEPVGELTLKGFHQPQAAFKLADGSATHGATLGSER